MDSALPKLPAYQGTVYRTLGFDDFGGKEAMDEFVAQHRIGDVICYGAYSSSSRVSDGHVIDGEYVVTLVIESITGRNLEGIGNNSEQEVLFGRFADFATTNITTDKAGHAVIHLKEVFDDGGIQQRTVGRYNRRNKTEQQGTSVETSEIEVQRVQEKNSEYRSGNVRSIPERNTEETSHKRTGVSGVSTVRVSATQLNNNEEAVDAGDASTASSASSGKSKQYSMKKSVAVAEPDEGDSATEPEKSESDEEAFRRAFGDWAYLLLLDLAMLVILFSVTVLKSTQHWNSLF